jgi:thiol:disulfide interchange protein DsbA
MSPRHLWILAVLAIAGCGGNGAEPSSTTQASSTAAAASDDDSADAAADSAEDSTAAAAAAAAVSNDTSGPSPTSAKFRLGTHYNRLSPTQPTSSSPDKVEVAEIFWYGCPHCFAFDPYLQKWLATKPDYVSFVRVPAVWNPLLRLHARAFYTAEQLGKGAEMHDPLFNEIHKNGNPLDTEDQLRDFFGKFGVDATAFKNAFDSFAVHTKLERADELNRRYQIKSVPTIVVNGKYTTDAGMAGGYDELFALINELAAAEHAGK